MSERIVISPTSRQEGHAELVMEVDDEGIVTKGRYFSITPVRGLEKMVTGKAPETAPVMVQRICGVCPIPHTLASVEAIDDSLDIEVPKAGRLLRELTLAAHHVNSHAIHHFLIAPDFVPENLMADAINSVSEIRKNAQYVVDMVAGEGIHPSDVRIGGMADNITELARKRLYARLKQLKPKVNEHVELMIGLIEDKGLPEGLGVHNQPTLASHQIYGDRTKFDLDRFTEIMPESWYDDPEIAKRACSTIPLYDGRNVEVGPRARMVEFQGFKERGVVAQHVARALEMKTALSRAIEILDELDTSAPVRADFDERGTGKLGIGAIEAPRGLDVHMAKVENGKIQFYSALVPTTWNIPTMGPATEGFHHEYGPHVIRAYDPCLSCATHVMVVDDEDKSVIKNEMVKI
ncbi:coenzyme F420 hydrogenase subunit alpha [Methanothermobacter marburgensis]|uniref:Coenzyme F420 hydrogenase subunit alpha n=2 Tax=Methanothermobacter marburgensis TaxID=145263 RepID=D9PYF9_METTM|nr:coenzyme F420 hydrogenase subunit alpha [Methanothermobacter marburgensis]ADL59257.1 F420-reducing hydrogenase, subunit alpha [Methanothermobacter marburgensis str. Marburg]WBF09757.1 coenzyme F420 hydrogenase subunit alpha [Methanothermobacter marburgensis]3ZFS_A Chain A, F420-REDUCING HYDROGENASE, SUBUNIT ALPHA [Methanothermobacter marburgensis]4OMF_A Chain A, F420-reducing hydrogenase, subunit alpha [Methanothermobacter marburgensis str. Marburg]